MAVWRAFQRLRRGDLAARGAVQPLGQPRRRRDEGLDAGRVVDVALRGGFLGDWQALNRAATIPHCISMLEATGAVENLRRVTGESSAGYGGFRYSDSDLYKVLEATGWAGDGPWVDEVARLLATAQEDDGYLNSYYQAGPRFQELER